MTTPNENDLDRRTDDDAPRIAPLSDLDDYQVADGYPDVRGWDVVAADGRKVGTVHELIVDTQEMRTRYLDVSLDRDASGTDQDHDVLVPIGAARLDDRDDRVLLDEATVARLATLPTYDHQPLTREYEDRLLPLFGAGAAAAGADYYAAEHFDDRGFYAGRRAESVGNEAAQRVTRSEEELEVGRREVPAGDVEIRKTVETEHVAQPVTRRREEVTIERRPVGETRAASGTVGGLNPTIGEEEIRVPVVEEEVVVEKRPVVKEELVVRKSAVPDEQVVEADLRKEHVEVERNDERKEIRDENRDDSRNDNRAP